MTNGSGGGIGGTAESPPDTIAAMGWKRRALDAAHHLGAFRAVASVFGSRRLTVLTYHRIVEMGDAGSIGFVGNVSATPAEFYDQMRWVADRFSVVTMSDVANSPTAASADRWDNSASVFRRLSVITLNARPT